MLTKISFIGVDAHTDLSRLQPLIYFGRNYGFLDVEFGVLYSESNKGNRYQLPSRIEEFLDVTSKAGVTPSIHLCGSGAIQSFIDKDFSAIRGFHKVQLNIFFPKFNDTNKIVDAVSSYLDDNINNLIVFQQNKKTIPYLNEILSKMDEIQIKQQVALLFDSSGGRGKVLDSTSLESQVASHDANGNQRFIIGYAGGISSETVMPILSQIEDKTNTKRSKDDYYIDMENGIRDADDWFSLKKCWDVVSKVVGDTIPPLE